MAGIAFFDLDKTITRQGTWSRFVRRATPEPRFLAGLPRLATQAAAYKAGLASRGSVKECAIELYLRGRHRSELEAIADEFAEEEMTSGVRPGAVEAIKTHKDAGDRLVIASAAADLIVEAIGRRLGFEDFICTKLAWSSDGRLLPKLGGENCYGLEKLARVKTFMETQDPTKPTAFYSDHITDLPCLEWADTGVAVNPEPKLRTAARKKNVPIVDWDQIS